MKAYSERYYIIINRNNQKITEGDKCKRLRGIKLTINYNIQYTC